MKIHEYQAKALLAQYGVPVPRGEVARSVEEVEAAAREIGGPVVVKAQIHAGGRARAAESRWPRTPRGRRDRKADVGDAAGDAPDRTGGPRDTAGFGGADAAIERELYLAIVLDRGLGKLVFMASSAGGVEIEEVAAKQPELIRRETIEPGLGLAPFQARKLAYEIGVRRPAPTPPQPL